MKITFNSSIDWKKENIKEEINGFFPKKKRYYFLWLLCIILSLLFSSLYNATTKIAYKERCYTKITDVSYENDYQQQNMLLYDENNSKEGYKTLRQAFRENELFSSGNSVSCLNYLAVSSRKTGSINVKYPNGTSQKISMLTPKSMGSYKKTDGTIRMYSLRIKLLFEPKPELSSSSSCFISEEYANYLLGVLSLNQIENLLGHELKLQYLANGKMEEKNFMITNVYDSNYIDAPYLKSIFDNFVISYFLYSNNIDGLSLSIDFSHSVVQNQVAFSAIEPLLFDEKITFSFIKNSNYQDLYNHDLKKEVMRYLTYNEKANQNIQTIYAVVTIASYLASLFFTSKYSENIQPNNWKKGSCFIFLHLYIIFSFCYLLMKYIFNDIIFVTNAAIIIWLIILFIVFLAFQTTYRLSHRREKKENETPTEIN